MLSCHCLNVIIETEGVLQKVTAETLGLSSEEVQDSFFQQVIDETIDDRLTVGLSVANSIYFYRIFSKSAN